MFVLMLSCGFCTQKNYFITVQFMASALLVDFQNVSMYDLCWESSFCFLGKKKKFSRLLSWTFPVIKLAIVAYRKFSLNAALSRCADVILRAGACICLESKWMLRYHCLKRPQSCHWRIYFSSLDDANSSWFYSDLSSQRILLLLGCPQFQYNIKLLERFCLQIGSNVGGKSVEIYGKIIPLQTKQRY